MKNIPLVIHVVYRLDFGGLETLMVERINRMPADKYRHAVVCITQYTEFAKKIKKPNVELYALNKRAGPGLGIHILMWKLLRRLKPAILHTYNLSAVEYGLTAMLANVPVRIHGEHGRDAKDPNGTSRKYNLLRRVLIPFYDSYYSNSADLRSWLKKSIGVPDAKNLLLINGIDTEKFRPESNTPTPEALPCYPANCFVIGTVGRIQDVKDHRGLIDAFILLLEMLPDDKKGQLRLAIVGDGPLLPAVKKQVQEAGIIDLVWLPGARTDIADILRTFSVFTLSSIAEGTPGSILEAMATGLPVVATHVGGIPDVVVNNVTGKLVPASDPAALASAWIPYYIDRELIAKHGLAGRRRVEHKFNMTSMLLGYTGMYDALCKRKIKDQLKICAE